MNLPVRRTGGVGLDSFAARCGLHPDLVRRLVALGLVEPVQRTETDLWFTSAQAIRVDRLMRLRQDLSLNYNALGLVLDLLDRIEELERAAGRRDVNREER